MECGKPGTSPLPPPEPGGTGRLILPAFQESGQIGRLKDPARILSIFNILLLKTAASFCIIERSNVETVREEARLRA
jgi:hypothetical protein